MIESNDNLHIKLHDTPLYASIYRFGDTMLVTPQLYGTRGAKAPLMRIIKTDNDSSIYDSYNLYFDEVWNDAIDLK